MTVLAALAALLALLTPAGAGKPVGERQLALLQRHETVGAVAVSRDDDDVVEQVAVLAGGCFWGVELAFARLPSVLRTEVGYAGGHESSTTTYDQVSKGQTGHAEAVRITFDASRVSFKELLGVFFDIHDPTTMNRQGSDVGSQYRSTIFFHDQDQAIDATEVIEEEAKRTGKFVITFVEPLTDGAAFVPAEPYHQGYLAGKGQSAAKGETEPIRCYG